MKTARRLILALLFCISLLADVHAYVYAETVASGTCGENLTWILSNNNELVISGNGSMADYNDGSETPWASMRGTIIKATIASGVTSIGECAFDGCDRLTSVDIPMSVTNIGGAAFWGCSSLKSVTILHRSTNIGQSAFLGCSKLTSVTIKGNYSSIGERAFKNCTNLTDVTLPESFGIGASAFEGCIALTDVYYGSTEDDWNEHNFRSGNEALTNATIHYTRRVIDAGTCGIYGNNLTWTLYQDGELVISGWGAMEDYYDDAPWYQDRDWIKSVTLESGITSIGYRAFSFLNELTTVMIPSSVTRIGGEAFEECRKLKSVTIPIGVTSIEYQAFTFCTSLKSVTIPAGITTIDNEAFKDCSSLLRITIPEGVTTIGGYAFQYCSSLTSVTIPNSVTSIGADVFGKCRSLTDVYYDGTEAQWNEIYYSPYNVTDATLHCAKAAVTFNADNGTQNVTVTVVKGEKAEKPTDPVKENHVFLGWFAHEAEINFDFENTDINEDIALTAHWKANSYTITWLNDDDSVIDTTTVEYGKVPTHADAEKAATAEYTYTFTGWTPEIAAVTGDATYKAMFTEAKNSYTITWLNDDDSVIDTTTVEYGTVPSHADPSKAATEEYTYTFVGWTPKLMAVTGETMYKATYAAIPTFGICGDNAYWTLKDGMLTIFGTGEMYDFFDGTQPWDEYNEQINAVVVESGITSIGEYAFYCYQSIESLIIPASVEHVGYYSVHGLTGLKTAGPIGSGSDYEYGWTKTIPNNAFDSMLGLKCIVFPEGLMHIGDDVFSLNSLITEITLPEGLISLGVCSFYDNSGMSILRLPKSIESIGNSAFACCYSLTDVYYSGTEAEWNAISIGDGNEKLTNATIHFASSPDCILPTSLTVIGEEAFEGSPFTYVKMSERIERIERNAFANCPNLVYIYIPTKQIWIDTLAFGDMQGLTIIGLADTTVETYTKEHNFTFIPIS